MKQLLPSGVEDVLRAVWPHAELAELRAEKISHRRNADHWRVQHTNESVIVRSTMREDSARRIIAALTALQDEPYAPALRASTSRDDGTFLIAMEDLGDAAPTVHDMQSKLAEFVGIIRALHNNSAFHESVDEVGRNAGEDSSLAWAEEEWAMLREIAPSDERLLRATEWMDIARANVAHAGDARELLVYGHGDLHNANWRLTSRGPALIDWEEIRRWPLASELADFIVFGQVDPAEVIRLYGVPSAYGECVRREAAACALSFYLYWLRTMLDGSDTRPSSFEHVRLACERLF